MAVFKNYYNRKPLGYIHKWCITVSCLYLLCVNYSSAGAGVRGGNEKIRHRHIKSTVTSDDDYIEQLERNLKSMNDDDFVYHHHHHDEQDERTTPLITCPNCLYKHDRDDDGGANGIRDDDDLLMSETDSLRLEAIKRQILSKLGLKNKPNITYAFPPREVIMETLFRAEDSGGGFLDGYHHHHHHHSQESFDDADEADALGSGGRTSSFDTVDVDDFYGRTSEIISFAEQGHRVNGNRLLEFRVSIDSGQIGQEFRVRAATFWLKADLRRTRSTKCKSTELYVFRFVSPIGRSIKINSKEFNQVTEEPVTIPLNDDTSGWQKIDLTTTVREWLERHPKDKLRLFVDCSCCSNWHVHIFNSDGQTMDRRSDPNRPFLVIHTDPTTAKRVRRRALDCSLDLGNQCCKQRFYVSFKELGWDDWIIAPQGYYANYCRGDCGHHRTPDSFVTYHTHVIEEIRKTHHLSGMQPCCAPLKFSSMSLIYFGPDSNIIKRDLPKMVVDECGCP